MSKRQEPGSEPNTPPSSAADPTWPVQLGLFRPGERITERYEVVRFLARGGIGEVYEVLDLHLGERLALKTLQAHEAGEEVARERFRREIQLARRVTHPNVCRLFDAGMHRVEGRPPTLFLTMELLEGETLHDRLVREGRMSPAEALPLLRQMCDALDAAHAMQIVHRDFKSSNVILVPSQPERAKTPTASDRPAETRPAETRPAETRSTQSRRPDSRALESRQTDPGSAGIRAVVTDFGLARALGEDEEAVFRTLGSAGVSGTPAFMAPEQLRDGEIGPPTDIYALGVVVFQMLTGELPFPSQSALASAVRRLQEPPPSPRSKVRGLDRRWEAAILRCLEPRSEDRFASASEVVAAVQAPRSIGLPSRRRRWLAGLVLAMGVFALITLALWRRAQEPPPSTPVAGDPVQLTSDSGLEIDPSFSPDGRHLAYASNRDGSFELYLRPLMAGGAERQLTADGQRNMQPSFSPDGQLVAYVSQERGGIWMLPASGGVERRLSPFGSRPSFSPDGRSVVFQQDARKEISERTLPAMPPSTLWRVEIFTGSEPERLTEPGRPVGGHGEPAFSPDGRFVAFSSGNRRRTQIWTVELATGEVRPLVSEARVNVHPVYSAEGRGLYYIGISSSGRQSASYAVWFQAIDPGTGQAIGDSERVVRLGLATLRQMAISPSGDRLIYSALLTISHLYRLGLDADDRAVGQARALTYDGQRNSRPAFSPSGDRVAYDRWQAGTNLDIWLQPVPAFGSGTEIPSRPTESGVGLGRRLTLDKEWDSQATWLAGGRSLAYFSERGDRRGIWKTDLDTGQVTFLADIGRDADWARLSPDGKRIAFHSSRDSVSLDIWVLDLDTGQARRLTRDPHLAAFPIWSPDSRSLAIEIRRQGSTHLAVLDLDDAGPAPGSATGERILQPRQLTDETGESWPYSWSPEGSRIAFAGRREGVWNLYWVDRHTAAIEQLTDEQALDGYVRYPEWSPTGDSLVYEKASTIGDLWQVELHTAPPPGSG